MLFFRQSEGSNKCVAFLLPDVGKVLFEEVLDVTEVLAHEADFQLGKSSGLQVAAGCLDLVDKGNQLRYVPNALALIQ